MSEEPEILFERRGALGLITLNRPKALNALTHDMCLKMSTQLRDWAVDDAIKSVAILGAGERAFCAGGDIRALYDSGKAGTGYARRFWHDEYLLNAQIKHYPKPYIALINGIVMGGGVGVSLHGKHRVVSENVTFAMPETGIGLFPDVGGAYFLPRISNQIGLYLGLTGARMKGADCLLTGVATQCVPLANWPVLLERLSGGARMDDAANGLIADAGQASLLPIAAAIRDAFSGASVEDIVSRLGASDAEWARAAASAIAGKSPTSLKIAFRQLREGGSLEFDACMRMEYRIVTRIIGGHDFYEGVRATILDKDGAPKWNPARLEDVSDDEIDAYFAPLQDELAL